MCVRGLHLHSSCELPQQPSLGDTPVPAYTYSVFLSHVQHGPAVHLAPAVAAMTAAEATLRNGRRFVQVPRDQDKAKPAAEKPSDKQQPRKAADNAQHQKEGLIGHKRSREAACKPPDLPKPNPPASGHNQRAGQSGAPYKPPSTSAQQPFYPAYGWPMAQPSYPAYGWPGAQLLQPVYLADCKPLQVVPLTSLVPLGPPFRCTWVAPTWGRGAAGEHTPEPAPGPKVDVLCARTTGSLMVLVWVASAACTSIPAHHLQVCTFTLDSSGCSCKQTPHKSDHLSITATAVAASKPQLKGDPFHLGFACSYTYCW